MDKFKLEIELGNAAMETPRDVAHALRKVASLLERYVEGDMVDYPSALIKDDNGNKVGEWEFCNER